MSATTGAGLYGIFQELRKVGKEVGKIHNAANKGSLSEYLANTMVEPVCLIQSSLAHSEVANHLCLNLLEDYSCMYLQVASRLFAIDIDSVHVTRMLEKLATDRDILGALAATESEHSGIIGVGLENERRELSMGENKFAPVTENTNLSVGKLINVRASSGKTAIDIPVQVRLRTKNVPEDLIVKIFEANHADLSIRHRVRLAQLEEISWKEALTGSDIIAKQEELRIRDKDGLIRSHFIDAVKDAGYAALTQEVPINRASGISIIDTRVQRSIETAVRGKMEKFTYREKFFSGTASMVLAVVDEEDEVVHIYYRGIKDGQTLRFRQLEREAKKGGGDLTPVIKDMLQGRIPS